MTAVTLKGSCHCGTVEFEVETTTPLDLTDCNCSICRMTGFLHLFVGKTGLTVNKGQDNLSEYRFGTKTARHIFCKTCGVKPFYVPRSHPDGWSVNANCLDPDDLKDAVITPFDGTNWEKNIAALKERT